MSYLAGSVLVLLAAVSEVALLPAFSVNGLQPNAVLVLLVAWLVVRGEEEAFVLAPLGGLALGMADASLMGVALVGLAPLALVQAMPGPRSGPGGVVTVMAFAALMTLAYSYTQMLVLLGEGESGNWIAATTQVIMPSSLLNAVVAVPVYGALSLLSIRSRGSLYA